MLSPNILIFVRRWLIWADILGFSYCFGKPELGGFNLIESDFSPIPAFQSIEATYILKARQDNIPLHWAEIAKAAAIFKWNPATYQQIQVAQDNPPGGHSVSPKTNQDACISWKHPKTGIIYLQMPG